MTDYYAMSIRQLIDAIQSKDREIQRLKAKEETLASMSEHIKIIGRQNTRMKKDIERYRRILDRRPTKEDKIDV